ncbi:ankyrin-3-like [Trichogramma pretiosum]|uniref:ankyrin-3-like n=1 Tax=Trichogramma pretiosum TaxID=7493 RepID=UPI0006C973FA|nr:ankyrin-3-like [Trichogramma pretiosum]
MSRLEKLKRMRAEVDWNLIKERRDLLRRLFHLTSDWKVQLPNLLDVFRAEDIDWLLMEATNVTKNPPQLQRFIEFVARTGFKDEPKLDEAGKPISRRVTAVYDVNYTDKFGYTHFHLASEFDLDDVVEKFLDLGQDPNLLVKNTGDSPLHFAVAINYDDTTKICDERQLKVQVDAVDSLGNTPLHEAIVHDNRQLVVLLVIRGADLNIANNDGSTSLHLISDLMNNELLTMIFEILDKRQKTAQIDALDKSGNTPLQLALKCHNNKLVELLLRRGAGQSLANNVGVTPLHLINEYVNDYDDGLVELFFEI